MHRRNPVTRCNDAKPHHRMYHPRMALDLRGRMFVSATLLPHARCRVMAYSEPRVVSDKEPLMHLERINIVCEFQHIIKQRRLVSPRCGRQPV